MASFELMRQFRAWYRIGTFAQKWPPPTPGQSTSPETDTALWWDETDL